MVFTMLSAQDLASGQFLDLVKEGNTYNVNFTDKEKFVTKKFRTINEAQGEYLKIINYFIHGVYTFEQRANDLMDGAKWKN